MVSLLLLFPDDYPGSFHAEVCQHKLVETNCRLLSALVIRDVQSTLLQNTIYVFGPGPVVTIYKEGSESEMLPG